MCTTVHHVGRALPGAQVIVKWRRGVRNALYTEDNLQVHVPLYVSLLLIAGYITLGALLFGHWEQDWDFLIGES